MLSVFLMKSSSLNLSSNKSTNNTVCTTSNVSSFDNCSCVHILIKAKSICSANFSLVLTTLSENEILLFNILMYQVYHTKTKITCILNKFKILGAQFLFLNQEDFNYERFTTLTIIKISFQ